VKIYLQTNPATVKDVLCKHAGWQLQSVIIPAVIAYYNWVRKFTYQIYNTYDLHVFDSTARGDSKEDLSRPANIASTEVSLAWLS